VARLLPPESAPLDAVAREIGVSADTLERWRVRRWPARRERVWTAAARLEAVITTAAMDEAAQRLVPRTRRVPAGAGAVARERHAGPGAPEEARASPQQTKQDRRRIKELERELRRKDKALAETAALLVLSKKVEAIFNKGEDE
jgi:transposase